jgi:hypothetical protein
MRLHFALPKYNPHDADLLWKTPIDQRANFFTDRNMFLRNMKIAWQEDLEWISRIPACIQVNANAKRKLILQIDQYWNIQDLCNQRFMYNQYSVRRHFF